MHPRQQSGLLRCARNDDVEARSRRTVVVIPREGGESSTPRPLRMTVLPLEYWIARPSAQLRTRRAMTAVS